jgi:hypothetical protein
MRLCVIYLSNSDARNKHFTSKLNARRCHRTFDVAGLLLSANAFEGRCSANLQTTSGTNSVPNRTVSRLMLPHNASMRMVELTPKELSSVRCPTCGVPAGERCHLHSGSPTFESHLDRKLCAIEALEQKRIVEANVRATSKYLRTKHH